MTNHSPDSDSTPEFSEPSPRDPLHVTEFYADNGCVFATMKRDSGAVATVRPVTLEPGADHIVRATDYKGAPLKPTPTTADRALDELEESLWIIDEPFEHEYAARVHMMVEALWGERARRDHELLLEDSRPYGMTTSTVALENGREPIPERDNIAWGVYKVGEALNHSDRDGVAHHAIDLSETADAFSLPGNLTFETEVSDDTFDVDEAVAVVDQNDIRLAERRRLYASDFDAFAHAEESNP